MPQVLLLGALRLRYCARVLRLVRPAGRLLDEHGLWKLGEPREPEGAARGFSQARLTTRSIELVFPDFPTLPAVVKSVAA